MSELLLEPLSVLCEEVGIPVPAADEHGQFRLEIEDLELRVLALKQGRVVLLGVIGDAVELAENRKESTPTLMANSLTLAAARFHKQGTPEVLSLEPETGELILWSALEGPVPAVPAFLNAAESMLNELEFWRRTLVESA